MKLSNNTSVIFKNFATINPNLVINPGKNFATMSPAKDILAVYNGEDEFDKQVAIFNLNELLGVLSAFNSPDLTLEDKNMLVSEGKQKVKYVYADDSLLTTPPKDFSKMEAAIAAAEIEFDLTAEHLAKIQKMSAILSVDDLAFVGDGEKVIARVHDAKNPTGSSFDIDLETETTETFNIVFKVDKIKVIPGSYCIRISSKKLSQFKHADVDLHYFIAVESGSTFS